MSVNLYEMYYNIRYFIIFFKNFAKFIKKNVLLLLTYSIII